MTAALIVEFVKANWKLLLSGGLILVLVLYVEGLRLDNAHQATKIETLASEVATLSSDNDSLKASIVVANAALDVTNAAASKAAADFARMHGVIQQQNVDLQKQLDAIMATKDPATCNDSIIYLINNAKGFAQ
jgi:hypothetical protein